MNTTPPKPPRLADRLLEWFVAPHLLESLQGDLHEEFAWQVERIGERRARWYYWWDVLGFIKPRFIRRSKSTYSTPTTMDMLRNYVKIAFRTLAHNKVYSIINVAGLSIGLAAAMLIMLYTKDEVSYDQFHANNPNIYRIVGRELTPAGKLERYQPNTGHFQGPKFSAGVPEIKSFVRFQGNQRDIQRGNEVISQEAFEADSSFFSIFSFPLSSGNPHTALQQPNSVVISEEMAEKQFGTTDALGKTILFKSNSDEKGGFEPYTVTGVAKKSPQNSSIKFDVLLPMIVSDKELANTENWFNIFQNTFVLMNPEATRTPAGIKHIEAKMNQIYRADAQAAIKMMAEKYGVKTKTEYALQPLTDMHLSKDLPAINGLADQSNPTYSYILTGIALFILLIACINFVNLTVARSLKRAKEIGVRKVVGSGRLQLTFQFLGESFLLCTVAFVLSFALVQLMLPVFNQLANKSLALSYLFDVNLVLGYLGLFLATGFLAGFYPALVLSKYSPVQTLYNRFNLSGKNYLQKSLVVLQFALASFLIIATMTIHSQFNFLTTKDLGYDDSGVISINKSRLTRSEAALLKSELLKSPNIVDVAPKNGGQWGTIAKVNEGTEINFTYETVDPTFLPLFKIPVVVGRNFSPDFPADSTHSVLVNESFVKEANWKNPLGQVVDFWYSKERYQVVGVVKDYHFKALKEKIGPQLFIMKPGNLFGRVFIKIRPNTATASLQYIGKTFKKLFPIHPYSYTFMDEENLKRYESESKWKQIMLFGAILTIFISCIGLFGLATLSAERRTKEIGVRKVLGASAGSIVQLLSSDFLKLVVLSFLFAFPLAWYAMQQWLQNYPYRIDIAWWMFALAGFLVVGIALLTVSFQSVKAALMNPVKSLRSE